MDFAIDPELHFEEQTTVSGDDSQPVRSVPADGGTPGQDLTKQLGMSLGATLESQPGVAARSFGPAPARPVIRGLDGDRVQILQDGQRMGDLSSQSGDHSVTVNPAAASRIDVVRGPATLLYGANADWRPRQCITEDIPTRPMSGVEGNVIFDVGSAAREAATAADIRAGDGRFALHAGGGGRRSGDVETPEGELDNSQSRGGFGNVGLSWTGDKKYVGGSYGYDDTKYGIPIVEGGEIQLTPRRHAVGLRAGGQGLTGALDSYRATFSVRRYKHEELEGAEVGTAFKNNTDEVELLARSSRDWADEGTGGRLDSSIVRSAPGAEALSPNVDQRALSAFLFEEVTWPHFRFQFGGRVDNTRYTPVGEGERSFTSGSGSVGHAVHSPGARERLTFAVSLARAARNPALEELFYFGPHPGNFAFEIGNPDLEPEHALGFDASMRWRHARASGEVTYFRNDIRDYRVPQPDQPEELEDRMGEFEDRFPES